MSRPVLVGQERGIASCIGTTDRTAHERSSQRDIRSQFRSLARKIQMEASMTRHVQVPIGQEALDGDLEIPEGARGIVAFAHGSGSSRKSPRNRFVAGELNRGGLGTLLIDLLTEEEERVDLVTRELRFDIGLLAERMIRVVDWLGTDEETRRLSVGLFGGSTGAAAALVAAAQRPERVGAVVSRGGRADLAGGALRSVAAPTLLVVGELDTQVLALNRDALEQLPAKKNLMLVPGATHLFEEPGTLEEVARLAREWFVRHLGRSGPGAAPEPGEPGNDRMTTR